MVKKIETGLCCLSLALLALLPLSESAARLIFHSAIPAEQATICQLLLVVSMLSAMITTAKGEHLSIGLVQYIHNEKIKKICAAAGGLTSCLICVILFFAAAAFIKVGLSPPVLVGFIPDTVYALVMPLAFAVMALRFARRVPVSGAWRVLPFVTVAAGIVCSIPLIFKFLWGFDLTDGQFAIANAFTAVASAVKAPALILIILAALAGTPLFVILGALSILLIEASGGEIDVTVNQLYTGLTSGKFIAIPLFTLAGFFLSESRAGTRLVRTFQSLFSWFSGGMIAASVLICAFFTSFTGASGVTILALGGILYTILCGTNAGGTRAGGANGGGTNGGGGANGGGNNGGGANGGGANGGGANGGGANGGGGGFCGYDDKFSVGLLTSSGSIGLLFPPSLPLILVGTMTQTNILHLFAGGIVPGLILSVSMVIFGIIISVKTKVPVRPFNIKEAARACKHSFGEIILPFLLIGGYFSGILSLIELGAFALVYVFVLEVIIFKDIKLKDVATVFAKAIPITGGILAILGLSQALSYYIVDTQAPENFARWMGSAISSKLVFLLILNLALLVVGCLIDIFSAIAIVLPLIAPLGAAYGIDPVHLGIIFLINMEAGFLTPPVGLNLFLSSYRFKKPFTAICLDVLPFLLIQLSVVIFVTYCEPITMALVNLLRGGA